MKIALKFIDNSWKPNHYLIVLNLKLIIFFRKEWKEFNFKYNIKYFLIKYNNKISLQFVQIYIRCLSKILINNF